MNKPTDDTHYPADRLEYVLEPQAGGRVGPESYYGVEGWPIRLYYDKQGGSYRFVRLVNNEAVAGLQVMSKDNISGYATAVYCKPEHRRKGYATELYNVAKLWFSKLTLSTDRSADGAAWVDSLE